MKSKDGQFLLKLRQKIKSVRKLKKLSQEALAEKINIHPTTIGRIETGKLNASTLMLYRIADVLEVNPKEFFDF